MDDGVDIDQRAMHRLQEYGVESDVTGDDLDRVKYWAERQPRESSVTVRGNLETQSKGVRELVGRLTGACEEAVTDYRSGLEKFLKIEYLEDQDILAGGDGSRKITDEDLEALDMDEVLEGMDDYLRRLYLSGETIKFDILVGDEKLKFLRENPGLKCHLVDESALVVMNESDEGEEWYEAADNRTAEIRERQGVRGVKKFERYYESVLEGVWSRFMREDSENDVEVERLNEKFDHEHGRYHYAWQVKWEEINRNDYVPYIGGDYFEWIQDNGEDEEGVYDDA